MAEAKPDVAIEALRGVLEALDKYPRWIQALTLAYAVDRYLGRTLAEPLWQSVRTLPREPGDG